MLRTGHGSDSSADSRLSLLIPTKDRSVFLDKLLRFYASRSLGCSVYIGDASENPGEAEKNRQAAARHRGSLKLNYERQAPGITTVAGVHQLLEKITTPYTALCGDDDYLIPEQLRRCVEFLQAHPDYTSVTGDQAEVFVGLEEGNSRMKVLKIIPGAHKEAAQPVPSQRLLKWAYPAIGKNTFSVQPTAAMRWAWQETDTLGLDLKLYAPLHELSVNVLTVLQGKQKHLKGLYHVMLRHTQKTGFSGPVDYFDRIARWDWPAKVTPTLDRWTQEIIRHEALEPEAARRVAQAVFLQWLIPFLSRNRDRKLKEFHLASIPAPLRQRLPGLAPLKAWARSVRHRRQFEPVHAILKS